MISPFNLASTEGVFPEAVNEEIFNAPEGEVVGPIETDAGTYVIQVDSVTEATTTPFEEARAQIDEQLAGQLQQEQFSAFLSDYRDRWVELTVCADDFVIEVTARAVHVVNAPSPAATACLAIGDHVAALALDRLA